MPTGASEPYYHWIIGNRVRVGIPASYFWSRCSRWPPLPAFFRDRHDMANLAEPVTQAGMRMAARSSEYLSIGAFRMRLAWLLYYQFDYARSRTREGRLIVPLTKRKQDGTLYKRPDTIEALLVQLAEFSRDDLLARAAIRKRTDPLYIPTECLLYFVRVSRRDNSDAWFERLYKILQDRVLSTLPRAEGSDFVALNNERIRNAVFDRFVELLASDRRQTNDKLDFYEVRFDMALKRLRLDAQDKVWREANCTCSTDSDNAALPGADQDESNFYGIDDDIFSDPHFRERVYAAIDTLPPEQSRTMHLLFLGWPTYSSDPDVMTIAKALGCTDRSVRNYRDRAMKTLITLFNQEDDQ